MSIIYRTHGPGDLADLTDLTARAGLTASARPGGSIGAEELAENLLLDVNFDPSGLLIAEDAAEGVVGFLYATRAVHGIPSSGQGYLTIGCVDPRHRRRGIGSHLLRRALDHLRSRGASQVTVSGYPQAYFTPGVDAQAHPDGLAFLESHGFERIATAAAMHRDLDGYRIPAEVAELTRRRLEEGHVFATAGWDDLPEIISFASQHLAPDWGPAIRTAVLRHGRGPSRVILARGPEGAVTGFAIYGAYGTHGGTLERFGPFGVDAQRRGTGLGRILLHRTLQAMHDEGARQAWFLWTSEESPAGHLYLSSGFSVTRRFEVMRRDL